MHILSSSLKVQPAVKNSRPVVRSRKTVTILACCYSFRLSIRFHGRMVPGRLVPHQSCLLTNLGQRRGALTTFVTSTLEITERYNVARSHDRFVCDKDAVTESGKLSFEVRLFASLAGRPLSSPAITRAESLLFCDLVKEHQWQHFRLHIQSGDPDSGIGAHIHKKCVRRCPFLVPRSSRGEEYIVLLFF